MNKITQFMIAGSAAALLSACGSAENDTMTDETVVEDVTPTDGVDMVAEQTVVEAAQANPDFSTLVQAVTAADLGATLSGPGPFTVFAPNNAAFDKVGAETLTELMKPENKDKLKGILTYHVVSGNVPAADLMKMITDGGGKATLTTVQGGTIEATMDGDNVKLTDATGKSSTVILTDVAASNGVIHAIDTVVMPKA